MRSDLASIVEVPEEPFRPEDGGELRPDTLDVEQHCRRRWRRPLLHFGHCRIFATLPIQVKVRLGLRSAIVCHRASLLPNRLATW